MDNKHMSTCPHCQKTEMQVRAGLNKSGSQRMKCNPCNRRYTPYPNERGYPEEMRQEAVEMYVDDTNFRAIGRRLKVHHQTVINWITSQAARTPAEPPIAEGPIETAELDELFTFEGKKKEKIYIMTLVDRATRCFLGYRVVRKRSTEHVQAMLDAVPPAKNYFSDGYTIYWSAEYGRSRYISVKDKSETYAVEGGNAEIRHYLARLTRKSRCFTRCIEALKRAMKLFVNAWNRRQIHNRAYPKYHAHVSDFACTVN